MNTGFRTFCHINEFREDAFGTLPGMIFASGKLVLWGPSASLMRYLNEQEKCVITPESLIRLIDEGDVVVIGREEWIMSQEHRAKHWWKYAEWDSEFDATIRLWASDDEKKPELTKRVIIAPAEDGLKWASDKISQDPDVVPWVWQKAESGQWPVGYLEKMIEKASSASGSEGERKGVGAQWVLRDIYNHDDAANRAFAEATINTWETTPSVKPAPQERPGARKLDPKLDDVFSAVIELMRELPAFEQMDEARALKVLRNRRLRGEFADCITRLRDEADRLSRLDPLTVAAYALGKDAEQDAYVRYLDLLPSNCWELIPSAIGVVTALWCGSPLGLFLSTALPIVRSLEVIGVPLAWMDKVKNRWLYYSVLGRGPVSRSEIAELASALSSIAKGMHGRK